MKDLKIIQTRTNHIENPVGYKMKSAGNPKGYPLFSWEVAEAKAKSAKSIRIRIAEHAGMKPLVYDSGYLENYEKSWIRIPFESAPCTRYYWQVEVCTESDEPAFGDVSFYETGKEGPPWQAKWIGCAGLKTENPVFVRSFFMEEPADTRFYVCGLGIYELYVNGVRRTDEYFAPGCNEYDRWLQYQTYEIPLVHGKNEIAVSLGNGWYKGRFGLLGGQAVYGDSFCLIGELTEAKTGKLLLKTDGSWQVKAGNSIFNNFYDGEIYCESADSQCFYPVSIIPELQESKTQLLTERASVPVRIHETFGVQKVLHTPAGETVLDFGQNMAGFVRFHACEAPGAQIRLQYGEILQNGCFYRENLRSAKAEFVYHSIGKEEIAQPHFTFYGFRYVKVEGLSRPVGDYHFEACALYTDLRQTGSIKTGHGKINQLISNISWGQKGNYLEIPTDCPQRDERLGWTADTQVFAGAACYLRDSYPFLEKYCRDLAETQKKFGCVTNTIPAFDDTQVTSAGWGDAAVIIPWTLYQFYGDPQILSDQFESMKGWVDYIHKEDEKAGGSHIWNPAFGYGDWLARDHDNPSERMLGGTELAYVSTAYYYYSTNIVAKAAKILGREEAALYQTRAQEIRKAFQKEYFTLQGRLAVPTQTGYVLALYMGLCPDGYEKRVAADLHSKLENCQMNLKTGFIGTAYFMKVLSENGFHEDACRILLNDQVPGWLYAVNLGATTLWERWDSLLPDGSVNGTDMNSFNHYASGAVAEWMYAYLAGIHPLEEHPGFCHILCKPCPSRYLRELSCSYRSAAGTYKVGWKFLPKKKIALDITIPFGATATLELPYSKERYELAAGEYHFTYRRENDGTENINTFMPFTALRKIDEVKPILGKHFPGWEQIPETFAKESIRSLAKLPYFQVTEQALDRIDYEIREMYEDEKGE